jgi:hypothetical protein
VILRRNLMRLILLVVSRLILLVVSRLILRLRQRLQAVVVVV